MAQTHSLDLELSSSQYASITDASQTGLDVTGDMTIEAWINLESLPSSGETYAIAAKYLTTGNQRAYMFEVHNNGGTVGLRLVISSDGTSTNIDLHDFAFSFTTGTWYHVAITFDASAATTEAFINVSSQGTNVDTETSIHNSTGAFTIGAFANPGGYFDGLIKDVRVFSDIRTQAEIQSDARTENVSDANLVGEWNFNNDYTDSSGNSNTLTASGSPVFSTNIPTAFILFDAKSEGSATADSLTFSHTCGTGVNRLLLVGISDSNGDGVTGVTYNGVAMTQLIKDVGGTSGYRYVYGLLNPSSGTNDIVISDSETTNLYAIGSSYTGVLQSGLPDDTDELNISAGTGGTLNYTTTIDDCWGFFMAEGDNGDMTAGTNAVKVEADALNRNAAFDSGRSLGAAGAVSMAFTCASGSNGGAAGIVFAPTEGVAASTFTPKVIIF